MELAFITIQQNDKLKKETISENTPIGIYKAFGKYLAKQFSGQLIVREFHYTRSGDK